MNNDITIEDAQVLKEILSAWEALSNTKGTARFQHMTDHCHNEYDAGCSLADKLERIAKGEMQVLE
jgi:hypothetical protein